MHKCLNERMPEIWRIVNQRIDFNGATLLDVGFGHGDFITMAHEAGAEVTGIEKEQSTFDVFVERNSYHLDLIWGDFETVGLPNKFDYVSCMSVLPYMQDQNKALERMSRMAYTAIIECQYAGDGPGTVQGDLEMKSWLLDYWSDVTRIGTTEVEYRGLERTIWICDNES